MGIDFESFVRFFDFYSNNIRMKFEFRIWLELDTSLKFELRIIKTRMKPVKDCPKKVIFPSIWPVCQNSKIFTVIQDVMGKTWPISQF